MIIRNDETPEVVRRIFSEYLAGKGMDTIAKDLFIDNVQTPSQVANKKMHLMCGIHQLLKTF